MKLSCLCATHNRPAFMPWLAWVYRQIDWDGPKELVLVDSTPGLGHVHPLTGLVPEDELVFVPSDDPGITGKYNQALESASGDVIYWLDDDDYHVPDAAMRCLPHLDGNAFVYPWVDLFWIRITDWYQRQLGCFWWSAGLYRREALLAVPRFQGRSMCTEIRWIKRLLKLLPHANPKLGTVGFCLAHHTNVSNNIHRASYRMGRYAEPVVRWTDRLGLTDEHLGELLIEVQRLKDRIDGAKPEFENRREPHGKDSVRG